jgi:hypothetical protein
MEEMRYPYKILIRILRRREQFEDLGRMGG